MDAGTERDLAAEGLVQADFVRLETYATFKAITELIGEQGWNLVWRWGEIAFEELREQANITETEPLALVQRLSKWFVEMGYARSLEASQPTENVIVWEAESPIVRPVIMRLRAEDAVLPHFSAAVAMAALKKMCNIDAQMESVKSEILSPTRTRQRWLLRPGSDHTS